MSTAFVALSTHDTCAVQVGLYRSIVLGGSTDLMRKMETSIEVHKYVSDEKPTT